MKNIFIILTFLISCSSCLATHQYLEKEYQEYWCKVNNGKLEYRLQDKTRIDCLTNEYAIEFDFASKWAESIGQSLYYALSTNKKAGVVLILENPQKDLKYLLRLNEVAKNHNIKVWTIKPQDISSSKDCACPK